MPHPVPCPISAPEEKLPKAIVTDKSYDYVTFTFDHFAPEGYSHGYVAMVSPDFLNNISAAKIPTPVPFSVQDRGGRAVAEPRAERV